MRNVVFVLFGLLLTFADSGAQITNGDFEDGINGWSLVLPGGWNGGAGSGACDGGMAVFAAVDGSIDGDEACVSQEFDCGTNPDGLCTISVDYTHVTSGALSRVVVRIDGDELFSDFTYVDVCTNTGPIVVPCGTHTIELCLQALSNNSFSEAGFDNVLAECDDVVPTEASGWGRVKARYREQP